MHLSPFGSVSGLFVFSHPENKVVYTLPPNGEQYLEKNVAFSMICCNSLLDFAVLSTKQPHEEMNTEGTPFTCVTRTEAKSRQRWPAQG